ncbi:MAG: uroporphyrinogen decarboxylase family protein [Planctomycetota bacterium]
MPLTQLEQFNATIAHEKHENILFYADFTPDLADRVKKEYGLGDEFDLGEYCGPWRKEFGMFAPKVLMLRELAEYSKPDFTQYYEDIEIPDGATIDDIGVLLIPGSMHHFQRRVSPLRKAERFEQIEAFDYPNLTGFSDGHFQAEAKAAHDKGQVVLGFVGHMYENAWQIRGYEQFLMDMIANPGWCELILDKLTERNLILAIAAAKAGADFLVTGDDVANQITMMFDIKLWRKMMKPRWAKVYAAAKEIKPDIQIWYHSDGNITEIIPELIEIGVTILNPVQPECLDPLMVKTKYGDKLVMDGTIGTQTTMPFGSPDDVKKLVRQRIETLGADGALILSPTHTFEPEVPMENIKAFVEAANETLVKL